MPKDNESVKRIASILTTIEQKLDDVDKARANINQLTIVLERAEVALNNARVQLVTEIKKFDPAIELEASHA